MANGDKVRYHSGIGASRGIDEASVFAGSPWDKKKGVCETAHRGEEVSRVSITGLTPDW
jgi:hypothetical protein